jgi:hypothetical protein
VQKYYFFAIRPTDNTIKNEVNQARNVEAGMKIKEDGDISAENH